MATYVILDELVGRHFGGEVVEISDDQVAAGLVEPDRLVRLGAIRPASADEAQTSTPWGKSLQAVPMPFPPVPFQSAVMTEGTPNATSVEVVPGEAVAGDETDAPKRKVGRPRKSA